MRYLWKPPASYLIDGWGSENDCYYYLLLLLCAIAGYRGFPQAETPLFARSFSDWWVLRLPPSIIVLLMTLLRITLAKLLWYRRGQSWKLSNFLGHILQIGIMLSVIIIIKLVTCWQIMPVEVSRVLKAGGFTWPFTVLKKQKTPSSTVSKRENGFVLMPDCLNAVSATSRNKTKQWGSASWVILGEKN